MNPRRTALRSRAFTIGAWLLVVFFFASQRYIYDATNHHAERFTYYLASSAYIWGVLTPLVLWLGACWPMDAVAWKRSLPLHFVASLMLTGIGVFAEASVAWLPHRGTWPFADALGHYFTYHTQLCLLTYWALLAAHCTYRLYDHSRRRELRAAQLEAQLSEAQLSALRSQLQPHFLFNTMQAATTLIYDDPHSAEEILLSLSELLRTSLQTLDQQEIPLRSEIEFVRHYAAIQQRRFRDRLRFDFEIEEDAQDCAVPSLFLQPLVENAIHHGIGVRKQSDIILIRAFRRQERLVVEVRNAVGVLQAPFEELMSHGVGLANTVARLQHLYGAQQSFSLRNIPPRGVLASLSIPVRVAPAHLSETELHQIAI